MSNYNLDQAMVYAANGISVFPVHSVNENGACSCGKAECKHPGKHPRTNTGLNAATTDKKQIAEWWTKWSDSNIGIRTGVESRIWALDVDKKSNGYESLENLQKKYEKLPRTWTTITGGEGQHHIFSTDDPSIKNRAGILPGLDVRGEGGYIVAPPSSHKSGRRYQWQLHHSPEEVQISKAPEWLINLVKAKNSMINTLGDKILEGKRNNFLTSHAGKLRQEGLSGEEILICLLKINQERCLPALNQDEVKKIADSISRYQVGQEIRPWDKPEKIDVSEHLKLPELAESLIPRKLLPWVVDASDRMQVPPEFIVMPALVGISSLIGNQVTLMPKANDDWEVVPNLWGAILGEPGVLKTPSINEGIFALRELDKKLKDEFKEQMKQWEKGADVRKLEKEKLKSELKKMGQKGDLVLYKQVKEKLEIKTVSEESEKPELQRILTNDATIEALANLLCKNPRGIFYLKDELYGLLRMLDKDGNDHWRAFMLESWSGTFKNYSIDRIGRGSSIIPNLRVSVFGSIQPDRFIDYFKSCIKYGKSDDGLLQRFQLIVYPRTRSYELVDRAPNIDAKRNVSAIFQSAFNIGNQYLTEPKYRLRYSDEGQELFYEWYKELENLTRTNKEYSPAFVAHLSKYRHLFNALAAIFHIIENVIEDDIDKPVSLGNARLAAMWCEYLKAHALGIYKMAMSRVKPGAKRLTELIKSGELRDGTTVRALERRNLQGLDNKKKVAEALSELGDYGWLRVVKKTTGGRPTQIIEINPNLAEEHYE